MINPDAFNASKRRLSKLCNLDLIDLNHNARKQRIFNDILILLQSKVAEFPPHYNLRLCNEFLTFTCCLVEEVTKNDKKPDKKELVIQIFKRLFNIDPAEVVLIEKSIDFLCANGLVKGIDKSKKMFFFVKKRLKKFF